MTELPPGDNPIAVNKYYALLLYYCFFDGSDGYANAPPCSLYSRTYVAGLVFPQPSAVGFDEGSEFAPLMPVHSAT
jgi:hypothetical protein